jgi:hypothetical protein
LASLSNFRCEMRDDVITYLLLDFRLWIYTKPELQTALVKNLMNFLQDDAEHFRSLFGIQKILDTLRMFYWLAIPNTASAENALLGVQPVIHPVTKEVLATRPSLPNMEIIRPLFFDLLRATLKASSANSTTISQDVQSLCRMALDYAALDTLQLEELLVFIDELLTPSLPLAWIVLTHVLNMGGTDIFLHILKHDDEGIRVWCLRLIARIHSLCKDSSGQGSSRLRKRAVQKAPQDCIVISRVLRTFTFTESTYNGLFAFLLGMDYEGAQQYRENMVDLEIHVVEALPVILQLSTTSDIRIRQRVLEEVYLLLVASPPNRVALMQLSENSWQSPLFCIYALPIDTNFQNESEVVRELVLNVLKVMIVHTLKETKPGKYLFLVVFDCSERGISLIISIYRVEITRVDACLFATFCRNSK